MRRRLTPAASAEPSLEALATAASGIGLIVSGAFHPAPMDEVPALPDGRPAATLVLLGHVGPVMWEVFSAAPEFALADDPLDRWSRRVIAALGESLGATPLFPFAGPPFLPFGRWALRSGAAFESPLGILIHPRFGLWQGFRGALAFAESIHFPTDAPTASPCERCPDRPCLSACPVGAFLSTGYAVEACLDHLRSEAGGDCRHDGCQARRACPVGRAYRYGPAQMGFHMRQFLAGWIGQQSHGRQA